ncbi:hypothetical protein QBC41DRAFT_392850 [Cercophora samala]|uniref:Uncharacterized protein n=1 Tax=Cercophora samala TaxID=330535 RepID=A0AA39ZMN0_9PEZI|nr:hypothetical protein QBC41DRAFT_392850 [Cercophora samala]
MGKRAASTRPSEMPQDNAADLSIREFPGQKSAVSHKRRASLASQPAKHDTTMDKTVKSNLENKERAYVAASRRTDRSLEDRLKSAYQASEVHFQRTGKHFRITRENVEKGLWYDEIDESPRHRLAETTMDLQTRARHQNINEEFHQYFGNVMPPTRHSYPLQFMPTYPQHSPPQYMPSMPVQQQMNGYPARSLPLSQPPSYASQQGISLDSLQYRYGGSHDPSRRSISPASSSSAASRGPATSLSPVSMGTSSNPTSPDSEIDSSAAEMMASVSRNNSYDHFTSNSPMLSQDMSFINFPTSVPNRNASVSAHAIDPELHSPPTAYFANMGFGEMGPAYPSFSFDFQEQPPTVNERISGELAGSSDSPPVDSEDNWDDFLNSAEFEDPNASQGAQGRAHRE